MNRATANARSWTGLSWIEPPNSENLHIWERKLYKLISLIPNLEGNNKNYYQPLQASVHIEGL